MATYRVSDPETGRTLKLTGDSPPTEQELEEIFSQFSSAPSGFGLEKAETIGGIPSIRAREPFRSARLALESPAGAMLFRGLGGMGGAVLGGGTGMLTAGTSSLPGAIAGGAAGAATGESLRNFLASLAGGGPRTMREGFVRPAVAAGEELVGAGLGLGAGKVISKIPDVGPGLVRTFRKVVPVRRTPAPPLEELLSLPEQQAIRLPPAVRSEYIAGRRAQLAQPGEEAAASLERLHQETVAELKAGTEQAKSALANQSQAVLVRFKEQDAMPLLTKQSTRYRTLADPAIRKADATGEVFDGEELGELINETFGDEPVKLNIAIGRTRLQLTPDPKTGAVSSYTPSQVLDEIDRIGRGVKRSPTSPYGLEDDVADDLRDTLLTAIEQRAKAKGIDVSDIRQAKAEWKEWKPVQKQISRDLRLFEEGAWVSDQAVGDLLKVSGATKPSLSEAANLQAYHTAFTKYAGKDLAEELRPMVGQLNTIQRKQVAVEIAHIAEQERLTLMQELAQQPMDRFAYAAKLDDVARQRAATIRKIVYIAAGITGASGILRFFKRYPSG